MNTLRDSAPPVYPDDAAPADADPACEYTAADRQSWAESSPLNADGWFTPDDFDCAADDEPPVLDEWAYFDPVDLSDDASGSFLGHGA